MIVGRALPATVVPIRLVGATYCRDGGFAPISTALGLISPPQRYRSEAVPMNRETNLTRRLYSTCARAEWGRLVMDPFHRLVDTTMRFLHKHLPPRGLILNEPAADGSLHSPTRQTRLQRRPLRSRRRKPQGRQTPNPPPRPHPKSPGANRRHHHRFVEVCRQ